MNTQNTHSGAHTVIGSTVTVEGKLISKENITIAGTVKGSVETSESVTVANGATVQADINGQRVIIAGTVTGNITAQNGVELAATAQVTGDISSQAIAIESGAVVKGMIATQAAGETHTATEQSEESDEDAE